MRRDVRRKLRVVVQNGHYADREFLHIADGQWHSLMTEMEARVALRPEYANALRRATKQRMNCRKEEFYHYLINHVDDQLNDPNTCPTFESAIQLAATESFAKVHKDVYDEIVLFFGEKESSSPVEY